MSSCTITVVLLLAVLVPGQGLRAQAEPSANAPDRYWLSGGIGVGRAGGDPAPLGNGLAGGLAFTYQPGILLFTLRTDGVWNPFRGTLVADRALLVGVGTRLPRHHASIAIGPALMGGERDLNDDRPEHIGTRLGIGIQAQALGLPLSGIGLGFTAFANINDRATFGGIILSFAFGALR